MWSSENERLGFRNCCPVGYFLINVSFVAFLASAAFVVGVGGAILLRVLSSGFSLQLLFLLLLPVLSAIVGWACYKTAWLLAGRKGFIYDYESDKCTWNNGRFG